MSGAARAWRGVPLLGAQRASATLAVLAAAAACGVSGEFGLPWAAAFLASLAASLRWAPRVAHRFDVAWTTLLAAALVVLALQVVSGALDVVLAASWFVLLLTTHRLWNRATERDELLLLLLSLLLLCAGAALSAELLYGFAFVAYSVSGTWALALTHLRFRIEAARGPEAEARLQSRRLVSPALLGALGALSLLGLVGATLVFFTFPRVTLGGLRRASRATPSVGLANQVELRGHGTLADDPRVVLRVKLDPDPGRPVLDAHWRARAFEAWTGLGWRSQAGPPAPADLLPAPSLLRRTRVWTVADIEAVSGYSDGIVLTPAGWPLSVRFVRPLTARAPPQRLLRDAAGDLFYQPIEVGDLRYVVTAQSLLSAAEALRASGPLPEALPREARASLEVPADLDPRVRALGERLAKGRTPAAAAEAVRSWLEASIAYTRELPGDHPDPIAQFLFERKKGHCELFSSAMVLILRSAGVPARNVTGFYGGVRTEAGYYAVRAGDAHSWAEVWVPGLGFVPFDPTPAADRGSKQDGPWARAVLFWDGLAARWRAAVVDYDLLSQGRVLKQAADLLRDATRRLSGKGPGGAPRLGGPLLALAVAAGAGVAFLLLRGRLRLRRVRAGRALSEDQLRAQELVRRARARLLRAGLAAGAGATPRELEALARRERPAAGPPLQRIVEAASAARWGSEALPVRTARGLLRELDRALEGRPAAAGSRASAPGSR